jgi:hypothetical protein
MRRHPVLPVAGFEIEDKTGLNAKHIKGSLSNLNNLGAQMGCVVIGSWNFEALGSKPPHQGKSPAELEALLLDRVYRWVYAESQPAGRVVVMSESQVLEWAKHLGVPIPGAA